MVVGFYLHVSMAIFASSMPHNSCIIFYLSEVLPYLFLSLSLFKSATTCSIGNSCDCDANATTSDASESITIYSVVSFKSSTYMTKWNDLSLSVPYKPGTPAYRL
jgi:hypothetical protein